LAVASLASLASLAPLAPLAPLLVINDNRLFTSAEPSRLFRRCAITAE
jgi:hypothetical protein